MIEQQINEISSFDIVNYDDYMDLFGNKKVFSKYEHIKANLQKYNETIKINKDLMTQIPKGLVMDKIQRFNIIYQEI